MKENSLIQRTLITTLTYLTTILRADRTVVKRSYNIHPDETFYFNYKEAFVENSEKKLELDFSWQKSKNYEYEPITISETKILFENLKKFQMKILKNTVF